MPIRTKPGGVMGTKKPSAQSKKLTKEKDDDYYPSSEEEAEEDEPSPKRRCQEKNTEEDPHAKGISKILQSRSSFPLVIIAPSQGAARGRACGARNKSLQNSLTDEEYAFYSKLDQNTKHRISQVHEELSVEDIGLPPFKFRILQSNMSISTKRIALKKLDILNRMNNPEGEYHKLRKWIDKLCDIPFGKTIPMPVDTFSTKEDIQTFLTSTKSHMDTNVYGHQEAKDMIIRIMAQWISNPNSKGNVIGIHGKPGVGKTTLIKDGVCPAIGLPFAFVPLGGTNDASYLDGHSYTYEGSSNGKIIDSIIQAGCDNPVLYFDELDKVSDTAKGKEIINVLIHLTDPSQNTHFNDKYFADVSFDLSKCLIVFTYNNPHMIDPILKDRMITIQTKDYTIQDKIEIASEHLLPSISQQFGLHNKRLVLDQDVTRYIVNRIENEAGVRNLKRALESIVSNINLYTLLSKEHSEGDIVINRDVVDNYVKSSQRDDFPTGHMYM